MFPVFSFSPNIEYPLSGDVVQDIDPHFGDDIVGVPEIEREIVTRVTSYGDQLGALTDAVLALAHKAGLESKEIVEVQRIHDEVKLCKSRVRVALRTRAELALRRLKAADPEAYDEIVGR